MDRGSGFYRLIFQGSWQVGYWNRDRREWLLTGSSQAYPDSHFDAISTLVEMPPMEVENGVDLST